MSVSHLSRKQSFSGDLVLHVFFFGGFSLPHHTIIETDMIASSHGIKGHHGALLSSSAKQRE